MTTSTMQTQPAASPDETQRFKSLLNQIAKAHSAMVLIEQEARKADALIDHDSLVDLTLDVEYSLLRALRSFEGCRVGFDEAVDCALGGRD